jgi:(1->4)-alpha-D-glucan 1-alpha-D-glucosylmutase
LLGVWSPHEPSATLTERVQAYLVKATREEKRATSWMHPHAQYEQALGEFAARLLDNPEQNAFFKDFTALAEIVNYFGHLNSLVQTILKFTSPGVPDLYQGTEAMSLALVDPDNRRPVDYAAHAQLLDELAQVSPADIASRLTTALGSPYSSDAKLFVTSRLLQLRRELTELFAHGDYVPLQTNGERKDHVLAFARTYEQNTVIVVLAKWMAQLMHARLELPVGEIWGDSSVAFAAGTGESLRDIFSGTTIATAGDSLRVADVFSVAPFSVLMR